MPSIPSAQKKNLTYDDLGFQPFYLYAGAPPRICRNLGRELMEQRHCAALSLLGVTYDTWRLGGTVIRGVTKLALVTYESPSDIKTYHHVTGPALDRDPSYHDILDYVRAMCNPDDIPILTPSEFNDQVQQQTRRVCNDYKTTSGTRGDEQYTWNQPRPFR